MYLFIDTHVHKHMTHMTMNGDRCQQECLYIQLIQTRVKSSKSCGNNFLLEGSGFRVYLADTEQHPQDTP